MEARDISELRYYDQNGKKYDNYEAYLEQQTDGTAFAARVQVELTDYLRLLQK